MRIAAGRGASSKMAAARNAPLVIAVIDKRKPPFHLLARESLHPRTFPGEPASQGASQI